MKTSINSIVKRNIPHVHYQVSRKVMPSVPILFDRLNCRFLHNKSNVGVTVSRRTRARKHQHVIGSFTRKNDNVHMSVKFPITSKLSSLDLIFPPFHKVKNPQFLSLFDQVRHATTSSQCVTDEKEFDSILHEREFEMHRHSRSPINRIVKYAKDTVNGGRHEQKILDLASTPIDPSVIIAKEIPQVLLYTLSPSRDILKLVSDKVVEENVANVMIQYNELDDLSEFESNSFDLVISCYGLQNVKAPSHLINEIHRVLKPGGRVIAAVWEHSGTKPIVDRILAKVKCTKKMEMETDQLTVPHLLETIIEKSGLKVLEIQHGEYPIYLSTAGGLHASAFDIVSLPIKRDLVELMNTGERPYAFEDARAEFDNIVSQGNLVTTDSQGRLVVEDNRYKIIVARRQYEDNDRRREIEKAKESKNIPSSTLGLAKADADIADRMKRDFNQLLIDTLHGDVPNSPWKCVVEAVKRDILASGHNGSKIPKVLDLASFPNHTTKLMAEELPSVHIHSFNMSAEGVNDMKKYASVHKLNHITSSQMSGMQLKDFEDASMDVVTCAFGLTQFTDPTQILQEIHRVLKPGGSFIATAWDSIALERIGDAILSEVLSDTDPHIITPISNLSSYSTPRKFEQLIESAGNLSILKSDHYESPFQLGDEDNVTSEKKLSAAFQNAIIPIHHLLKSLEESGVNPNAFDDARRIYNRLLEENQLMWKDDQGKIRTVSNRFQFIIARRKFEDADGILDKETFVH